MTGKRIVAGVDFSGGMFRGAPWVAKHLAPDAEMILAHAVERPPVPSFLQPVVHAVDDGLSQDAALARLTEWRNAVGLPCASLVVRQGRPDIVLRDVANAFKADLIVIGAHGGSERPWRRLGRTAERLARSADTSTLIVRGPMVGAPQHIVVAVDDVAITERVVAVAGMLAERNRATLQAVHVLSDASYSHMLSIEAAEEPDRQKAQQDIREALSLETLRWLRALWVATGHHATIKADIPHGNPAEEILRIAHDGRADLIVIGRYGIGRVIPPLFGSVLGSVMTRAECPVLVVTH